MHFSLVWQSLVLVVGFFGGWYVACTLECCTPHSLLQKFVAMCIICTNFRPDASERSACTMPPRHPKRYAKRPKWFTDRVFLVLSPLKRRSRANLTTPGGPKRRSRANFASQGCSKRRSKGQLDAVWLPKMPFWGRHNAWFSETDPKRLQMPPNCSAWIAFDSTELIQNFCKCYQTAALIKRRCRWISMGAL